MLVAFRSADAGPRGAAARVGLAALLACIGLTWTAGATSAFATYGTVKVTKVNEGGDPADSFHFNASTAIKSTGGFDLKGGESYSSSTVHANAGAYDGPAYTVSEPANDKYELKSLVCSVTAAPYKPKYGSATTDVANRSVAIKVGVGEKVDCTFTNQRKTGTITVKKQLVPASDPGRFDLQVDGTDVATQVGDNGSGTTTVTTGTHTVGEAGANLGDYVSSTSCRNAAGYEVAKGTGVLNVAVASKDAITCTITNTRMTGTIVVTKRLLPSTDPGRFDLQVDGADVATQVGDGGTGSKVVPTGSHTVGEAGANLADYTSSTSCKDTSGTEVATGSGAVDVTVGNGDTITCTITNTRKATPTPPSTPQPPSVPTPQPQPAPAQAVAGVKTVSRPARGTAALQGPRTCPRTASVSASVRGRQIRRVTFFVRGHKVKTVTKAANGRWTLTLRTSSLRRGANAVTARVEFTTASRTKTRTLRITITRCAARVVQPQFTG
jgi:prealbumin domain-containing protein